MKAHYEKGGLGDMKIKRFLCAAILLLCVTAAFSQRNYVSDEFDVFDEKISNA